MKRMNSTGRRARAPRWQLAAVASASITAASIGAACDRSTPPPTEEVLLNATYLSEWSEEGTVTLVGGEYRAPGPTGAAPELVIDLVDYATGDLDGDGDEDAAVVLVERTDELRALYRLHALLSDGREVRDVSTRLLGDQMTVEGMRIADGVIEADLIPVEPGQFRAGGLPGREPGGRPPPSITSEYVLTTRGLLPASLPPASGDTGDTEPSAEAVPSLTGESWVILEIRTDDAPGVPYAGEEQPALSFVEELRSEDGASGRLFGSTGCNRVLGSYQVTDAGRIRISGLATTRRACGERRMEFEQRLTLSLGSALEYEVLGDELDIRFAGGVISLSRAVREAP